MGSYYENMEKIVTEIFGHIPKLKANGSFQVNCPHCGGKKKLDINMDIQAFRCPKCDAKGGYMKLLALYDGYYPNDLDYETLKEISKKGNVELKKIVKDDFIKKPRKNIDYRKISIANNCLFKNLSLSDKDKKYLSKRGISDFRRYKSLSENIFYPKDKIDASYFKDIPGFIVDDYGNVKTVSFYTGILFPYVDIFGNMVSFQIRTGIKGKKYVYLSSSSLGGPSSVSSYGVLGKIKENTKSVILTEGALKADITRQLMNKLGDEVPVFVAIPGVNNIKKLIDDLGEFKRRGIKTFHLAFDMDKYENKYVLQAEDKLKRELLKFGFNVDTLSWDRRFKGIDDFYFQLCKNNTLS